MIGEEGIRVRRVSFEYRASDTMALFITGFGGTLKPFFSLAKTNGIKPAIVREVKMTEDILLVLGQAK